LVVPPRSAARYPVVLVVLEIVLILWPLNMIAYVFEVVFVFLVLILFLFFEVILSRACKLSSVLLEP